MNEQDETGKTPPPIISGTFEGTPIFPPPKPFSYWAKKFLACNPFYLVSAAMLLFGLYRISVDPNFQTRETSQLVFNFLSLQIYEILLVLTAAFLAARRIWYDSTLLVGLENLLIFVPFILISQAALIDERAVWVWCAVGALIAISRTGFLKRYIGQLNFPKRSLLIGFAFLVINVALPVIYRILHEHKYGTKPDWGAAYYTNIYVWVLVLPAAFAMANFLPHARETGSLLPQRRWLPAGLFALWALATSVHLYALDYIYDFDLRREWVMPTVWVLAWTAFRKFADIFELPEERVKKVLIVPPILLTLLAVSPTNKVFVVLAALNALIYGAMFFLNRANQVLRHLLFASVMMLVAGLPGEWMRSLSPDFNRNHYVAAGIALYFVLCAALSRNPKLGMFGAITTSIAVGMLVGGDDATAFHWAMQSGCAFLLLHSLRWHDFEHQGAMVLRVSAALLWTAHSFTWMHGYGQLWMPCVTGGIVLIITLVVRIFRGRFDQPLLPVTASLVMLSGPGNALIETLRSTPSGLLAVIGSFVLFAAGTIAALTKPVWHRPSCHSK